MSFLFQSPLFKGGQDDYFYAVTELYIVFPVLSGVRKGFKLKKVEQIKGDKPYLSSNNRKND